MHPHLEAFHRPKTLEEAFALLSNPEQKAIPVAGATEVSLRVRSSVKALVCLGGLGLDTLTVDDDGLHLGAMVRTTRLVRDPAVREAVGDALVEACLAIASEPIRNLTSIGGNVVHVTSWSDTPPAFRVLDARFRVQGTSDRTYTVDEWFAQPPKKLLNDGDLLTDIVVPRPAPNSGSAFLKHAKTAVDFALVNAAAFVTLSGDKIETVRIAIGAIHTPPIRLPKTEALLEGALLEGATLDESLLSAVAAEAAAEVSPVKDPRASEEYLRHCTGVLARRAVVAAAERARGGAR